MLESDIWAVLRSCRPKRVTAHRIETGKTALGVSDVLWFVSERGHNAVGWCEMKGAVAKEGRIVLREELSVAQADFLLTARKSGCAASVLVCWRRDDCIHFVTVKGERATDLVGLKSLPALVDHWPGLDCAGWSHSATSAGLSIWSALTAHRDRP